MKKALISLLLFAAFLPAAAQNSPRKAVVSVSANYMREQPSYRAENGDQALMGTMVDVMERDGYWVRIQTPDGYDAWTTDLGLAFMDDAQAAQYEKAPKYICVAEYAHVYEYPSLDSRRVCDLTMGGVLLKGEASTPSWVAVNLPSGRTGWVPAIQLEDLDTWLATREQTGEKAAELAQKFVGVPYFWGGNTVKGFDCSGLAQFVYMMLGRTLPRNATPQAREGEDVPVDFGLMRPGDLIFFGSKATDGKPAGIEHVGIWLGGGKMIHASHYVRINDIADPSAPDYYKREIVCVRRIFKQ